MMLQPDLVSNIELKLDEELEQFESHFKGITGSSFGVKSSLASSLKQAPKPFRLENAKSIKVDFLGE